MTFASAVGLLFSVLLNARQAECADSKAWYRRSTARTESHSGRMNDDTSQLDALRVASLALSRYGKPFPETKAELLRALYAAYPANSPTLNRELSQLLIALDAPSVRASSRGFRLRESLAANQAAHAIEKADVAELADALDSKLSFCMF